ncbi:glutamate receptor ionotropic, kainate 2-like [Rhipicephalus microplus]|uniref:glutamate receptor ionotropic, kainate 2-like n=1 Tax=Rhipicephalus microplus TaxID=6941 RepID=UPI003F6B293D
MRQGCGLFPRAASTRIIAATWWIFSFGLVSSYTANLAAFLTKERLLSPIESAEDLAKQSAVRYGCVRSGSTHALFKEWKHETYEMMWHAMKEDLVSSIAMGIGRVERGGYAFLMDSTSIEYVVRRRCQLKQIGGSSRLQGLWHRNAAWISVPQQPVVTIATAAGARHPAKIQGSLVESTGSAQRMSYCRSRQI